MTQIIWTVLVLFIGALLGFGLGGRFKSNPPIEATPVVIGKITELADLVVMRIQYSRVHVTKIGGYVGSVNCIVLVNADLEVGTNIARARWEEVDTEARTATLVLAKPKVRRARLDHDKTTIYRIDNRALWSLLPTAEASRKVISQALTEAQNCVEEAGDDSQYVDRSKRHTELVLQQFLQALGWEVKLVWAEKPEQE